MRQNFGGVLLILLRSLNSTLEQRQRACKHDGGFSFQRRHKQQRDLATMLADSYFNVNMIKNLSYVCTYMSLSLSIYIYMYTHYIYIYIYTLAPALALCWSAEYRAVSSRPCSRRAYPERC